MRNFLFLLLGMAMYLSNGIASNDLFNSYDKNEVRFIKNSKKLSDEAYQSQLRNLENWQQFVEENGTWYVVFNEENAKPHRAFGKPIPVFGVDAQAQAEYFINNKLASFNIPTDELVFLAAANSGNYQYVRFGQRHEGLKLLNTTLTVQLTPDGKVVAFGADVYHNIELNLTPSISSSAALNAASSNIQEQITTSSVQDGLRILPIPGHKETKFKLVYECMVETMNEVNIPARYYTLVDAHTGEVLYRQNQVRHIDCNHRKHLPTPPAGGADVTVTADVYPTNSYDAVESRPLAYLQVSSGGNNYTDINGQLNSLAAGTATFSLEGSWCEIRTSGSTPFFTATLVNGANNISFNSDASIRERSAYHSVNVVHDYMKSKLPSFTGLDISLPTNIDVSGNCNAFYNGSSINFYPSGNDCNPSSTVADVVYHEYGHGINDHFYQSISSNFGNGAMHEGYADIWALGITENPILGRGFYSINQNGIRRYDIDPKIYPQDLVGEVHADGEIIAGAWWDLGQNFSDIQQMMDLFIEVYYAGITGPNGNEGQLYTDVLIETLLADDALANGGDNDITNGTPNDLDIVDAFARHGITLLSNATLNHIPIETSNADQSISIEADITLQYAWALEDAKVFYKINRNGSWNDVVLNNTSGNSYSAAIPAQVSGTLISYYVALEESGGILSSVQPISANLADPNLPYYILVDFNLLHREDFDTQQGNWTEGLPSDNATTGEWVIDVPIGSYYDNTEVVQPNEQHTLGGVACAVTGNAANTSAGLGDNDVDDGETTLVTPSFDLTDYENPLFVYWRWFTNDPPTSANPGNDPWEVEISGDGNTWTRVERTYTSDRSWRRFAFRVLDYLPSLTANTQIRFIAEDSLIFNQGLDFDGGSLVEAAIDDLELYEIAKPEGIDETAIKYLDVYPNPSNRDFNLTFGLTTSQEVTVELHNTVGQLVYSKALGSQPPGSNSLVISTEELRAGIYMMNLKTESGIITKRLSLIK